MKHQTGYFKNDQAQNIFHQCWLPDDSIRAAIAIVHGLADHGGRYGNVVDALVPAGYAVFALDHAGHGKSDGIRAHIDQFSDLIDPLVSFVNKVAKTHPGVPLFLVGHSLGGLIAATYAMAHQDKLAGLVLSAPAVKVSESVPGITIFVGKILSKLMPRTRIVKLNVEGLCRDPEVVAAYENDALVYHGEITARLGAQMLTAIKSLQAGAGSITLPVIILQGSADRLVDPLGADLLMGLISSPDKTLRMYDGLFHEVFNEPEKAYVLDEMKKWLEMHVDSKN